MMNKFNFERDLINSDTVRAQVQNDHTFAQELYAALCNNQFVHTTMRRPDDEYWSCSWRYAGDLVAGLVAQGEGYLDYYCGGHEGTISSRVAATLADIGWSGRPYPKTDTDAKDYSTRE